MKKLAAVRTTKTGAENTIANSSAAQIVGLGGGALMPLIRLSRCLIAPLTMI